jgi:hypothetical protein
MEVPQVPVTVMGILGCLSSLWELSKHPIAVCVLVRERVIKIRVPVPFIPSYWCLLLLLYVRTSGSKVIFISLMLLTK